MVCRPLRRSQILVRMRNMKKTHDNTESSSTMPNLACRFITWMAVFCLGFQPISPAFSMVMTDAGIENDLSINHEFFRDSSNRDYQYIGSPYVKATAPVGDLTSIEKMLEEVIEKYDRAVGGPKHIPIGMNGITLFIPTYPDYKVVGDPLVQGRFVRAQLRALLGRSLIDAQSKEYANEAAQLKTLYGNALQYINSLPTAKVGDKQSFSQDNAPARSMIWPELRTINDEEVLVPIVYLTASDVAKYRVRTNRTEFIGGGTLGNLEIDGIDIMLGRNAFLNILNDLTSTRGSIVGDENLHIEVGGELKNLSSLIKAKEGFLNIGAKSITSGTIVHQYRSSSGDNVGGYFGEIAGIEADGTVLLRATEDINILGSTVNSGGVIRFEAGGDINVGTVHINSSSDEFRNGDGWRESRSRTIEHLGSSVSAEQLIRLSAEGEIKIDASEITSTSGHIEILAGLGISITDSLNASETFQKGKFHKTTKEVEAYKTVAMRSLLDAGTGLTLHTDSGDITLKAVDISTTTGTNITTNPGNDGTVMLQITTETDHYNYSAETKGLFTNVNVERGHIRDNIIPPTISGGFHVQPLYGLEVQYQGDPNFTLDEQLDALDSMPGLEWIADVRASQNVEWTAFQERYEEWDVHTRTLTPAARALITIAVAAATGGAASFGGGILGSLSTTVGTGVTAGVGAASISLITAGTLASTEAVLNGEDPFDAAFNTITDSEVLRTAAISGVTAGALEQVNSSFFDPEGLIEQGSSLARIVEGEPVLTLTGQVLQAATHAAARATIQNLVNGADVEDVVLQSLLQSSVDALGQELANRVSSAFEFSQLDGTIDYSDALRYISHAATGCVIGAVSASINDGDVEETCAAQAGGHVVQQAISDVVISANDLSGLDSELGEVGQDVQSYVDSLFDTDRQSIRDFQARLDGLDKLIKSGGKNN